MIIHLEEIDSTSNELRRRLDAGFALADYDAIRTDFQTAGRGQVGNHWESAEGQNLLISIVVRPANVHISQQFSISMAVSNAVCNTVRNLLPEGLKSEVKVKWPNDIYVGMKKIAGILIENKIWQGNISETIIGLGLNINQTEFVSDAPNPISLSALSGKNYDVATVANNVIDNIKEEMRDIDTPEKIQAQYLNQMLWNDNAPHAFREENGRAFAGRIVGCKPDGVLSIEDVATQETKEYLFKEVEHIICQ